jgi:hypothetical protein
MRRRLIEVVLLVVSSIGCKETTPVDPLPPSVPDGLYSITGNGEVQLYWHGNDEDDLAGYNIYRREKREDSYSLLATVYVNLYVDREVHNGNTYYYKISSFDYTGNESALSSETARDTPRPEGTVVLYSARSAEADRSGYDFDRESRVSFDCACADVYLDTPPGIALLVTPSGANVQIQDAGVAASDQGIIKADWAPIDGWAPSGTVEVILGHVYILWTADNHFAALYVHNINLTTGFATFDWSYQLEAGNPELVAARKPLRREGRLRQ